MECDNAKPGEEHLLEHLSRVRQLARCLVKDPNVAEDILQEVYLLALERPPRTAKAGRELWAWMRRVARTMARQHYRGERRRRLREELVSVPEHRPSFVDDLVIAERAAAVRTVLDELPEPYGSTLRLRLLKGLEPREIARLQGIPSATVRMRLTRALRRAQKKLEPRRDRRHVGGLFAFFLRPRRWRPVHMGMLAGLGAVALVTAAICIDPRSGVETPAHPTVARLSDADRTARDLVATPVGQRVAVTSATEDASSAATLPVILGRVLWSDGRPAAGVSVRLTGGTCAGPCSTCEEPGVAAADDGSFALAACFAGSDFPGSDFHWIAASDPERATILAGTVDRDGLLGPALVVVAETRRLSGIVLDDAELPVASARLSWMPPADLRHRLGASAVFSKPLELLLETDERGHFVAERLPVVEGAFLAVRVDGFPSLEVTLALDLATPLIIRLEPATQELLRLRGCVVDPRGLAVAGAAVCLGLERCSTAADGSFDLAVARSASPDLLRVAKPGFAPLVLDVTGERSRADAPFLHLRLETPHAGLRGRVVDVAGRALAGVHVLALDLEAAHWDGVTLWSHEGLLCDPPRPVPPPVLTDAEGRFRLRALRRRPYRVIVVEPGSLLASEATLAPGAPAHEFTLSTAELMPRVDVTLTDRYDTPIERATLWVMRPTADIMDGERRLHTEYMLRAAVRSTGTGSFELTDVPRDAWIQAEAAAILPTRARPAAAVELVGFRRCELALVDAPARARFVRFKDDTGAALPLLAFGEYSAVPAPVIDGRTSVLTVSDRAAHLELLDEHELLLGSVPLALDAERLNRISAVVFEAPR